MTPVNLQLQIEAMSVMVRVEGMRAQNTLRATQGERPEYDFEDFEVYACQLENIMQAVDHN